ncbi:hypothetical protein C2G38_2213174 [Gigaspora rosea]|uniref:Uncharacterized protein n=1 Tax=Gigaspora rosea TaxID=44941 RepID=A0A397UKI1_9GLOM|nr:hypothetical protein C2G38_2213174 [Gigaspora rosea]
MDLTDFINVTDSEIMHLAEAKRKLKYLDVGYMHITDKGVKELRKRSSAKDLCENFEKWQSDERELNESKSLLEIIKKSYYENMFKDGSNFINTRKITEKLSEMILVSKGIDSTEVPDDD